MIGKQERMGAKLSQGIVFSLSFYKIDDFNLPKRSSENLGWNSPEPSSFGRVFMGGSC